MQNLSYENMFDLHENKLVGRPRTKGNLSNDDDPAEDDA